jgi:hypothetical protein
MHFSDNILCAHEYNYLLKHILKIEWTYFLSWVSNPLMFKGYKKTNKTMDTRITYIIIGLVVGAGIGYFAISTQVNDLRGRLSDSQMQYVTLSSQYQLLEGQKSTIQQNYNNLSQQKTIVDGNYVKLQEKYNQLYQSSQAASKAFLQLSENITTLENTLKSYCFLADSFARTLNNDEIQKVGYKVNQLLPNEPDYIAAYDKINTWITGQIKLSTDGFSPYITTTQTNYNGTSVNSRFILLTREEYIQTPELTINKLQGDSENQAILEYAMMKYYDRSIKGNLNDAYYSVLTFSDGSIHSAIFCPINGGRICIFDPSGVYVTRNDGTTGPKIAASELGSYYNYWFLNKMTIANFTFYKIDTINGSYTQVFTGSLAQTIAFFSK